MQTGYEQIVNAAACGLMIFRKTGEDPENPECVAANREAETLLGQSALKGKSWRELTGIVNLPLKFEEEILSLPNARVCRVIKRDLNSEEQLYTLLDVSAEKRSKKDLEEFSYIASHDLQEPLRKITSFGERIDRNRHGLSQETALYLSRMLSATERMQVMLNGLLNYSRIARSQEQFVSVDMNELVREAANRASSALGQSAVKIHIEHLPEIDAIPGFLSLLFEQLFSNSLKFVGKNVIPEITVTSEVMLLDKQVVIRIKDNGIGFENEHAEKIFSLFHRLHGRSEFEGAGIGLALCRKIMEKHSGSITAHSVPDKGALFVVTLPLTHH